MQRLEGLKEGKCRDLTPNFSNNWENCQCQKCYRYFRQCMVNNVSVKGVPSLTACRVIQKKRCVENLYHWQSIVHHEFIPESTMVNRDRYKVVLTCLHDTVHLKCPEIWAD
jgi:hypothetical protein